MNKDQGQKWRDGFEDYARNYNLTINEEGNYSDSIIQRQWKAYKSARKEAQKEIEKRDRLLGEANELFHHTSMWMQSKGVQEWMGQHKELKK